MEKLLEEILDSDYIDSIKESCRDGLTEFDLKREKAFCALETALNAENKHLLDEYAIEVYKYEDKCESELFIKGFEEGAKFILKMLK